MLSLNINKGAKSQMTHSQSRAIERVIIAFELIVIIVCICERWPGGIVRGGVGEDLTIFF